MVEGSESGYDHVTGEPLMIENRYSGGQQATWVASGF